MDDDDAIERARFLAEWLNLPIAEDELPTVARMQSAHARERGRMLEQVFLTEEPVHVFSPLPHRATSKERQP